MIGFIASAILLGVLVAADNAKTEKTCKEICKEKGWGDQRHPRSNESLQRYYFYAYVELKTSVKPIVYKNGRGVRNEIAHFPDYETGGVLRDENGNFIRTTRYDRYLMAKRDFEEKGYYWDDRYNPRPL